MNSYLGLFIGLALIAIAIFVSLFCPEWGTAALTLLKGLIIIAIAGVGIFITVISIINIRSSIKGKVRY